MRYILYILVTVLQLVFRDTDFSGCMLSPLMHQLQVLGLFFSNASILALLSPHGCFGLYLPLRFTHEHLFYRTLHFFVYSNCLYIPLLPVVHGPPFTSQFGFAPSLSVCMSLSMLKEHDFTQSASFGNRVSGGRFCCRLSAPGSAVFRLCPLSELLGGFRIRFGLQCPTRIRSCTLSSFIQPFASNSTSLLGAVE